LVRFERYEFDAEYVRRLVSEDPEAEAHFTRYFGDLLSIKLRSRLRSAAMVQDAKQEVFLRVLTTLKRKGGLANPESLGAFVNSVCNNVLLEMYRSGGRTASLGDDYDEPDDRRPPADDMLMADDRRGLVIRALAALPDRDRNLLKWLFFDERDKDDICREMGIDRNHLRVLLHRAKNHFRERLADDAAADAAKSSGR
jgi:RNA polymerase sigma-70 factor (ECF subfamily)